MAYFFLVPFAVVLIYLSTFIHRFVRNLRNARNTGFPSIIVPIDPNHSVWQLTSVPLLPVFQKWLPKFVWDRISLCIYGWEFREKLRPFEQYSGPQGNDESYMLVTSGSSPEFWTRDPEIVMQILGRPGDFNQSNETVLFVSLTLLSPNGMMRY